MFANGLGLLREARKKKKPVRAAGGEHARNGSPSTREDNSRLAPEPRGRNMHKSRHHPADRNPRAGRSPRATSPGRRHQKRYGDDDDGGDGQKSRSASPPSPVEHRDHKRERRASPRPAPTRKKQTPARAIPDRSVGRSPPPPASRDSHPRRTERRPSDVTDAAEITTTAEEATDSSATPQESQDWQFRTGGQQEDEEKNAANEQNAAPAEDDDMAPAEEEQEVQAVTRRQQSRRPSLTPKVTPRTPASAATAAAPMSTASPLPLVSQKIVSIPSRSKKAYAARARYPTQRTVRPVQDVRGIVRTSLVQSSEVVVRPIGGGGAPVVAATPTATAAPAVASGGGNGVGLIPTLPQSLPTGAGHVPAIPKLHIPDQTSPLAVSTNTSARSMPPMTESKYDNVGDDTTDSSDSDDETSHTRNSQAAEPMPLERVTPWEQAYRLCLGLLYAAIRVFPTDNKRLRAELVTSLSAQAPQIHVRTSHGVWKTIDRTIRSKALSPDLLDEMIAEFIGDTDGSEPNSADSTLAAEPAAPDVEPAAQVNAEQAATGTAGSPAITPPDAAAIVTQAAVPPQPAEVVVSAAALPVAAQETPSVAAALVDAITAAVVAANDT